MSGLLRTSLYAVAVFGAAMLLLAGCDNLLGGGDSDGGDGDNGSGSTVGFSIEGAAAHDGSTVRFSVWEAGADRETDDYLASAELTISGGTGQAAAESGGSEHAFTDGTNYDVYAHIDANGNDSADNGEYIFDPSGDGYGTVTVDGDTTVTAAYPADFAKSAEELEGHGPFPETIDAASITLGQTKTFRLDVLGSNVGYIDVPTDTQNGKPYGVYVTNVTHESLGLAHGRFDSSNEWSNGTGSATDDPDNNNIYLGFEASETPDWMLSFGEDSSDPVTFDVLVREAVMGGASEVESISIALDTPTLVGADGGASGSWFHFTAAGSTATIELSDLTKGTDIAVYDAGGGTEIDSTTGAAETDFSNSLSVSGLSDDTEYEIELTNSASTGVSVGTLEVTSPSE